MTTVPNQLLALQRLYEWEKTTPDRIALTQPMGNGEVRVMHRVETLESHTLNTYALMNCDCLVLSEAGLQRLTERLSV